MNSGKTTFEEVVDLVAPSGHYEWIDPRLGPTFLEEFRNLPGFEQRLRNLIQESYPGFTHRQKANLVYKWTVLWLSRIDVVTKYKFIYLKPNLMEWEDVFRRDTASDNIAFNVCFLEVNGYVLDPQLWAGHSLKHALVLYYIFLTNHYIVYVESEKLWFQYEETKWQLRPPEMIVGFISSWVGKI